MRRLPFLFTLFLAACGGNGEVFNAAPEPLQHVPEISNLKLSPDSALYMEGGGSVQVTAEFSFTDLGQDIETLHVTMSDGTSLAIPIADLVGTVSGTLAEAFAVTTADANARTVEIWVIDKAGQSSNHLRAAFSVIQHAPEISSVTLSTNSVLRMDGGGSVTVAAEVTYRDIGRDIQSLWVRMPDGTTVEYDESSVAETGAFTEDFNMSTEAIGTFTVEFWLVDKAGDSSDPVTTQFLVVAAVQVSDWTNRRSGLPVMTDVAWNGNVFIAVGDDGVILTSADGIEWVTRASGTEASLNAVAAYGAYVVAVGFESPEGYGIILQSTDSGASWTVKDRPAEASLAAVAINSSQVVVGGHRFSWVTAITMISEDRGDTWRAVDSWPDEDLHINDLVYRDGMFVATTYTGSREGAWVTVSSDGKVWNEISVSDELAILHTIFHDDSQFILGGNTLFGGGAVFTSPDGFNWTQLEIDTPIRDVFYTSVAWSGSKLVLAGPWSCGYLGGRCDSPFNAPPVGLSTSDGGVTWDVFNIDGDYESWGLAWGNGRFVSVGRKSLYSSEGAIYTAE